MGKYPFKFLDSYNREDHGIFFGRDEEIAELYEMVFQSSVILIYGGSGTGKTSLINCGLAGKFQPHDWLPLMIRRGSNINDSLEKELNKAGGNLSAMPVETNWHDEWSDEPGTADVIASPIGRAIRAVYEKSFRPIYLVFDQFEELFIIGSQAEQELFTKNVQDILKSDQPVKLIFSIREEYLGYLYDFERAVPQLMRKKLRVEPMNMEKVKQVITGAAGFEDSLVSIKPGETDQVAEGIFNKIKGKGKSLTIQLPFLQVFLDKFYLKITGNESRQAEAEFSLAALHEIGEIGDILVDFLEEQVSAITKKLGGKYSALSTETTWKILSPLSTLEGTKEPISKKGLYERLTDIDKNLVDDVVDAFINSRILRYNEATDTFEIAHDSLAMPISKKRSAEETAILEIRRLIKNQVSVKEEARELFTEKQLLFIEPFLGKLKAGADEQDWIDKSRAFIQAQKEAGKRKHRRRLITAGAITLVVFTFILLYAFEKTKEANRLNNLDYARKLLVVSNNAQLYGDFQGAALISRAAYLLYKDNGGNEFKNFYLDMFEKLQFANVSAKGQAGNFDSSFLIAPADNSYANSMIFINGYVYTGKDDGRIIKNSLTGSLVQPQTFYAIKKDPAEWFPPAVTSFSVSKDQDYLAVSGNFKFVQLFDLHKKTGEPVELKLPGNINYIKNVSFTGKGNLLMLADDSSLLMMDGAELAKRNSNGNYAYLLWRQRKQFEFKNGEYVSLDTVHREAQIAWNTASLLMPGTKFNCVSVFRDIIAIGIDSGLVLIKNDSLIRVLLPGAGDTKSVKFDSNGEYIYFSSETIGEKEESVVKFGKINLNDFSAEMNQSQEGLIMDIACSKDGNFIATASEEGNIGIYNTKDDVEWKYAVPLILEFPDSCRINKLKPGSLAFSDDSNYLLAGYENGILYKWPVDANVLAGLICDKVKLNWDSVYSKYADKKEGKIRIVKNYMCK